MHKFPMSGPAMTLVLALSAGVLTLNAGDLLANEGGGGARRSANVTHARFLASAIRGGINAAETAHLAGDQATIDLITPDDVAGNFWMTMMVLIYGDAQRPQARELQDATFAPRSGAAPGAHPGPDGLTGGLRLHADPSGPGPAGFGSGTAGLGASSSARSLANACESSVIRLPVSAGGQTRDFCARGPAFPLGG